MPAFFLLLLLIPMRLAAAEALPPVALRVTHESAETTHEGVERRQRFSEFFVREGANVWIERVLPEAARRARPHEVSPGHEKEIEVMVVPRWITRGQSGGAALALVAGDRKTLFEVPRSSHEALGFSERWIAAACFIDPASVRAMPLAARKDAPSGARWHEQQTGATYVRVLWDEARQYPRIIETGRLDGQQRTRTAASLVTLPDPRPWREAQGYTRRDFSDLGD